MTKVIVIGAGVVGLWCALRLRQGGAHVTLLEAEAEHPSPWGPIASAAAAGMLAPFDTDQPAHRALGLEALALWRQARPGAEWADGVRFDGGVYLHADETAAHAFMESARAAGAGVSALNAAQMRKRTGLQPANGMAAAFVADEGLADPLRTLTGLAMQARALGVLIAYKSDVAQITASSARTHDGQTYEADRIVLAPGIWATEALMQSAPALRLLRPAKGHLTQVAVERACAPNVHAAGFYLAARREDVVLGGGPLAFDRFDRKVEPAQVDALAASAHALFPGQIRVEARAWAGVRPMSRDGLPMVGPNGDVLLAAGHSRHGWLLAPLTAEIVAAYALGREIPLRWSALSPHRLQA